MQNNGPFLQKDKIFNVRGEFFMHITQERRCKKTANKECCVPQKLDTIQEREEEDLAE